MHSVCGVEGYGLGKSQVTFTLGGCEWSGNREAFSKAPRRSSCQPWAVLGSVLGEWLPCLGSLNPTDSKAFAYKGPGTRRSHSLLMLGQLLTDGQGHNAPVVICNEKQTCQETSDSV